MPVDRSDWATPIVIVRKKDWGIRICSDFKVFINPVLQCQTYQLHTPEEMFSALANGESYTKLDLARAYKQMKVKEECQPLLTINSHHGLYRYTQPSPFWYYHSTFPVATSYGPGLIGNLQCCLLY